MKNRKTTLEEKNVKYCISNDLTYKETAEKYNIYYHQIYSWIKKYKEQGLDRLADGRGRGKPTTIQTAEEKLCTEIAALKKL